MHYTFIEKNSINFKDCKNKFKICNEVVRLTHFLNKAIEHNAANPFITKYKVKTNGEEGINYYNLVYTLTTPKVFKGVNIDGETESHTINKVSKVEIDYYKVKDKKYMTIYIANGTWESCIKIDGDDKDCTDMYKCVESLFTNHQYLHTEEAFSMAVKNLLDDGNY